MRKVHAIVLAGTLIGLASSAAAETVVKASNVRITVEVGGLQGGKKVSPKTYTLLAPLRGATSLNSGARVPFAVPQAAPAEGKDNQPASVVSSYNYQNLGISIGLETIPGEGGRINVRGSVEVSLIRTDAGGKTGAAAPPTIGTFNQRIDVMLQDGKPTRLAVVDEPGTEPFYVDMKAELVE